MILCHLDELIEWWSTKYQISDYDLIDSLRRIIKPKHRQYYFGVLIKKRCVKSVKWMADQNIKDPDNYIINIAIENNYIKIVRDLIRKRATIRIDMLHTADRLGHYKIGNYLEKHLTL